MIVFPADVLNVHSPMDLITPDMLNMELFQASPEFKYTKVENSHPLAASLALHFQPNHIAYNCLQTTLVQCFGILHNQPPKRLLNDIPNNVNSVHAVHTHFQEAVEYLASNTVSNLLSDTSAGILQLFQHFCGAMAALESLSTTESRPPLLRQGKTNYLSSKNRQLQFHMLASLLVFGPTSIFSFHHAGVCVSMSVTRFLLKMGVKLLQEKMQLNPGYKLPESPFDTMHLHILKFLLRMGFQNLHPFSSIPMVNWKDVVKEFHSDFSLEKLTQIISTDVEIVFSNMPHLPFSH